MFNACPDVMTVKQVASALGIGKNSAYQLIREHKIGNRRVGRKIIVPKQCLIDFVQSARYTVSNS